MKAGLGAILAVAAIASSCSGGADDGVDANTGTTVVAVATTVPATTAPTTTVGATTTSTAAPTTTTTLAPRAAFDLGDLPALYDEVSAAYGNPAADPYETAVSLAAFPIEIRVPDGSSLVRGIQNAIDVSVFDNGDGTLEWNWHYSAISGAEFADLDFDTGGPGVDEVTGIFDPVFADLDYRRTAQVASAGFEPAPDDPISINWVYEPEMPGQPIGGFDATVVNARVWADEDLQGNYSDVPVDGYVIEVTADLTAGDIPVPVLAALAEAMPLPNDAALSDAGVRLIDRGEDSFAAQDGFGTEYLVFDLSWTTALAPAEVQSFLAGASFGDQMEAGEVSFFGEIEPEDFSGLLDQGSSLVLLQRYPVDLDVESVDGGTELSLEATVEIREVLPYAE